MCTDIFRLTQLSVFSQKGAQVLLLTFYCIGEGGQHSYFQFHEFLHSTVYTANRGKTQLWEKFNSVLFLRYENFGEFL